MHKKRIDSRLGLSRCPNRNVLLLIPLTLDEALSTWVISGEGDYGDVA